MTSTEFEAAKAMLLEAVGLLPADVRVLVSVVDERDILEDRPLMVVYVEHGARRAGLGIVGDGRDDGFDDVSAAVLAVRLEGMIRRWLARP